MVNILNLNGEDEKQNSLPTSTFQDTDVFKSQSSTLSPTSTTDQQKFLDGLDDSQYNKMVSYHKQGYSFDQAKDMLTSNKQEQQNYLNNLSDEQYGQMMSYYNQGYSFEEAQNKLQGIGQNTIQQSNGGGIRGQINQASKSDTLLGEITDNVTEGFNMVGNTFERLDEKVQELFPSQSVNERQQELQKKVDSLSQDQKAQYQKEWNDLGDSVKEYYGDLNNYMKAQEQGFVDSLLDTWKETDDGFNIKNVILNTPSSLLKTATAIARGVTNPYDTVSGIKELGVDLWDNGWDSILAQEYGSLEGWTNALQNDPVGRLSDLLGAGGLATAGAKAGIKGAIKMGVKDSAKLTKTAENLGTLASKLDNLSDLGITNSYNKILDKGLEYAGKSGSKLVRGAGKAVELSQRPLRAIGKSIFKDGSKLNQGNQNIEVTPGATEVANKVKEGFFTKVKNNFSSGLGADNRLKMYSNRYFAPIAKRVLNDIDTNGAPMRESQIGVKYYNELADNLIKTIDTYAENLEETGKIYEQLRNTGIRADLSPAQMNIRKYLRENGVNPVLGENGKYELRFAKDSRLLPIEQNQIKMAFDWIMNTNLRSADFDTFHGLRKDIDKKLVKWDNAGRQEQQEIVKGMRKIMNEEAHAKFPGFDKADNLYHREINELENLKYNLVYRGGPKKGEYKDNVGQHLKTIINTNKDGMRDRLQKIVPDIAEMSEAIELATKYGKAYQGSPALMKVLGKIGGAIAGIPTGNLWGFIAGGIIDEFVTKKLGEKMRKKVLQEIADNIPEDMQKELADIFIRDASGWELFEGEKQLRDQAVQEIAEAVSKITGEEKPESFKSKTEKQAETKPLEEKPSNEVKEEVQAVGDFVNEMNQTTTTNKLADTIDYSRMSDEGLNALLEEKNLPKQERKTIENILERRMQKEMQREAERGEKTSQFGVKDEVEFVRRAHQLQEMEKNIGKVGGKKVKDSTFKENQRKEREKKREKLIEEIGETYGIDQFEAYNRYLEYENAGVEGEQYTQRGGTKKKNEYDTEVQELLNKKKEEWSKQPQHIREMNDYEKQVRQDLIDSRGDGYEVRERDGGDAFIKNGDIIGRWNYKDGQISEIIFSTDDGFDAIMNNKRFLRNLPDDTIIHKQGEELSATAKELRDVKYGNEEKGKTMYQIAYHGGPNSFDRFDLSHLGEGEGAQAHGYGHYVALSEDIAKGYANRYGGATFQDKKISQLPNNGQGKAIESILNKWQTGKYSIEECINTEKEHRLEQYLNTLDDNYKKVYDYLETVKPEDFKKGRNLYTVNIPDEVKKDTPTGTNYLDEGVTISVKAGKEIADKLREKGHAEQDDIFGHSEEYLDNILGDIEKGESGKSMYEDIAVYLGGQKQASEFLNDLGYDGIKYDGEKDGPCAVLFTDEAMNIVNHEKYQIADQTKTPEFKKRFEGSKVVDENGNPLVVYHGTNAKFNTFDGIKTEPGYRFTEDFDYAKEHGDNVKSVYLNIKNVADLDTMRELGKEKFGDNVGEKQLLSNEFKDYLIEKGYDGMVWDHDGKNTYIAFNPNQIKSATDNIGTFDPNNPDIRYQKFGVAKQGEKGITAQEGLGMKNFKNGRSVEEIAKHYGIETKIVDQILTPNGDKALGSYGDGLIKLAKDLKESTVPHELLHATFDMVDSQTKQKILDVVKKKLEREGKMEGIKDKDLNAEERLADSFSEYFRTGKFEDRTRPKGVMNKIKEFFKRVKDFITGVYKERNQIKKLFDDILEEKIKVEKSTSQDIKNQMAYHGSKADFDKFDSSHIGEGQGAQVHGRGHYVTKNPENAKFYAKDNMMFKGYQTHQLDSLKDFPPEGYAVITNIEDLYKDGYGTIQDCIENNQRVYDREVKRLQEEVKQDDNAYTRGLLERTEKRKEVADSLKPEDFKIPERNFYEIDIPDPIKTDTPTGSNYLDENKKITPKQYEKFKILLNDYIKENNLPSRSLDVKYEDLTSRGKAGVGGGGSAIYDVIETILGSDKKASQFLNELGYDGIKYKDGRDGDSYVIFNDDKMNIKSHEKFQVDENIKQNSENDMVSFFKKPNQTRDILLDKYSTDKDYLKGLKDVKKTQVDAISKAYSDYFSSHTLDEIVKQVTDSVRMSPRRYEIINAKKYFDGDEKVVNERLKQASEKLREGRITKLYGGTVEQQKRNKTIDYVPFSYSEQIGEIMDIVRHAKEKGVQIGDWFGDWIDEIEDLAMNKNTYLEREKELKPYFDKIDESFKDLGEDYYRNIRAVMRDYNGDISKWEDTLKQNGFTEDQIKNLHLDEMKKYVTDYFKDKNINDYDKVLSNTEKIFIKKLMNENFEPDAGTAKEISNIFNKYYGTLNGVNGKLYNFYKNTAPGDVKSQMKELYTIIGKAYNPDVEKRQEDIYKKMGENSLEKTSKERKNIQQETIDTQDLTSLKSMFQELKPYQKYNEWITAGLVPGLKDSTDRQGNYQNYLNPTGLYKNYVNGKTTNSQEKETIQKLVAISNMTEEKFKQTIQDNGKIPMPSIAIMNPNIHHVDFGEIQMVFGKNTVDPKTNKDNIIYGTDAYTPTFGILAKNIVTKDNGSFIKGNQFKDGKERPVTPENILKAMQEGQKPAVRDVKPGSYKDMIQVIGSKIDDLEDVRKKNFADFKFHEIIDQIQDLNEKYDKQVEQLKEEGNYQGDNIWTDIKRTYSTDAKEFARKLNSQMNNRVSEETVQGLIDTIEKGRNSSIRFSESKPQRIVDVYNEVEYVLVPKNMVDGIKDLVKGTPLENKIQSYSSQGGDNRLDVTRTKKLHELQKKYGNVFFSMGGLVMPIAYLLQMMNGEDEEGQEA